MKSLWVRIVLSLKVFEPHLQKITSFLDGLKTSVKIALVLGGYLAAFLSAWAVLYFYQLATQVIDRQTYAAMYGFGDMILFCFVWVVGSLVPTFLIFYFLRKNEKFWGGLSIIFILLAVSGPLFEIANAIAIRQMDADPLMKNINGFWSIMSFFGLVRLAGSPFFILGYSVSAFLTPFKGPHRLFLISGLIEIALLVYVGIHLLLTHRIA